MFKLLIVDDQPSVHQYLQRAVDWTHLGIDPVLHAYEGKECLRLIETHRPDLMLLDIKMPKCDGMAVLEALQRYPLPPRIILLSAYGEFHYAQRAIRYGVSNYLLKPIDRNELIEALLLCIASIEADLPPAPDSPLQAFPAPNDLVEKMAVYLRERMGKPLTLDEIASDFYLSKYELCRRFKQLTGENLWPYLTRLRMERAKELLLDSHRKIGDVATLVGYNSATYFSNTFKQHTGVSPASYQQAHWDTTTP